MSSDDDTPDAETLLQRLGQKLTGDDDTESTESDTGQKGDEPDADADQKQPDGGDDGTVEDLVRALADEIGADPDDLMAAIQAAGQNADDMEAPDEEEEGAVDDEEEKTSGEVNIDFGAKLEEHGVLTQDDLDGLVTEDDLGSKMDSLQESIVEDLGEKLAAANEEAVGEIAQKMQTGGTPNPAGGSFQDEKDFETMIDEVAEKEGWS